MLEDKDVPFSSKYLTESEANQEAVIAQVNGKSVDVKRLMEQLEQNERNLAVAGSSLNVMQSRTT